MAYITATHLLEHVKKDALVVNDPAGVRNAPEKLLVTLFPELSPPTLITGDFAAASAFRKRHGDIIVKPLYASGGGGVFHIKPDDENLSSALEMLVKHYQAPFIVQKYLPEIREGDKRILLIEGEPIGVAVRLAAEGEARANLHAGGRTVSGTLTARDREICARIGPTLRSMGLILAGIDIIGDYMTEINVTSPTLMQQIADDHGAAAASLFWDAVEARHTGMVI
jgi:glutathione synthase